jgi:ABC-2 type transporter/ABC transporter
MVGRLYHVGRAEARRRADELVSRFDLEDAADRIAKTYSGGMRRRLDLAASLTGQPQVLFLDEPTTGLDPRSRIDLWEVIRKLVEDGTTLLLCTQYLEEADRLADRITVIDQGKVIAEGTADELTSRVGGDVLEFRIPDLDRVSTAAEAVVGLGLVVLIGLAFCCISAFVGLTIRDPESTQAASGMWIFPLVFASGVFVPVETMPGWLQAFAKVNPITIFVQALRGLLVGGPVATP